MTALPPLARWVLATTALLFITLNLVQLFVFGSPFGVTASPDTRITGYSVADAHAFLEAIGTEGRAVFFGYFRWIDTAFPPMLSVSLVILFRHIRPRRSGVIIGLFTLLPLAYLVADLVENAFLKKLAQADGFEAMVRLASDLTVLKYTILGLTLCLLIGFAIYERVSKT